MHRPGKYVQNAQWKALRAQAIAELDHFTHQIAEGLTQAALVAHAVRIQSLLIDLLEALIEPEEPE
jgi:hypothetical protein